MRRALPLLLALATLASRAHAAGLGIPDLGTSGLSQGGATIAAPEGTTALYYNPAALLDVEHGRAQLDVRATRQGVRFQRLDADGANSRGFEPITNAGAISAAPFIGIAYRLRPVFGIPVVVAIGGHPLNGYTGYRYPDPTQVRAEVRKEAGNDVDQSQIEAETALRTPQRYASISSDSAIYLPVIAAAAQITEHIGLGFGLQTPIASFAQRQAVYAGLTSGEDTSFDAILRLKASAMTVSGVFGLTAALPAGLRFGASFQLPIHFVAHGTIGADLPPSLQGQVSLKGDAATVDITFPWMARAGIRLVRPSYEIELAGTYEAWHEQSTITLAPHDVSVVFANKETPLPTFLIHKDLVDAGSLRLGGVWRPGSWNPALRWLTIRAGILGETSAVPEAKQSLDTVAWERLALTCGLAAELSAHWSASVGYAHFLAPTRHVRDSQIKQLTAFSSVTPEIVGNGDYDSMVDLFGLTVAANF